MTDAETKGWLAGGPFCTRVVVYTQGGVVTGVLANAPAEDVRVAVVDLDERPDELPAGFGDCVVPLM